MEDATSLRMSTDREEIGGMLVGDDVERLRCGSDGEEQVESPSEGADHGAGPLSE